MCSCIAIGWGRDEISNCEHGYDVKAGRKTLKRITEVESEKRDDVD
jgi:hypothetical protein